MSAAKGCWRTCDKTWPLWRKQSKAARDSIFDGAQNVSYLARGCNCNQRARSPTEPAELIGATGMELAAIGRELAAIGHDLAAIGRGLAAIGRELAATRSDRARARSDRERARSDRARARSDRARARSDRAQARSDRARAGISDRREFAPTERGVAAIAPVGSVGAREVHLAGGGGR